MKLSKLYVRAAALCISGLPTYVFNPHELGCCRAVSFVVRYSIPGQLSKEFAKKYTPEGYEMRDYWWADFSEESQNERCLFLLFCAEMEKDNE